MLFVVIWVGLVLGAIIWANITYNQHRANLTPDQQKEEDEASKNEGVIY